MIISPTTPPPTPLYGEKWERGLDPWHKDAFPEEFKSVAPEQGERRAGWFLIDWCGNSIGWMPDGTQIKEDGTVVFEHSRQQDLLVVMDKEEIGNGRDTEEIRGSRSSE